MSSSSAVCQNSTEHAEVLQSDSPHCVFKMPTSAVYTGGDISSTGDDAGAKVRKPYTITKQRERWTEDEHAKFLEALKLYGRAWRHIEEHVGTKTAVQIRSHAQKFFSKIEREASNGGSDGKLNEMEIPPPRPKKKPNHPYPRKASTMIPTTYIPCDATKSQEEPIKVATQAVYSAFSETKEVETLAPLKEMMGCTGSPPSSNGSKTAASLQLFGKRMVLLDPKAGDGVNSKRKEGFSPYVQNEDVSDLLSSSGTYVGNGRSYSKCQIDPATTLEGTGESLMTNASGFYPFQPQDTTGDLQGLGESDTNLDYMSRKRPRPSPSPRPSYGSVVDASHSNSAGFIAPPLLTNPGERFHHSMMMMMTMMPPWQLLQMAALGWLPGFVPPPMNLVVPPTNLADSSLFGSEPTNLPPDLLSYPPDISIAAAAASAWWAMHGGIPPPGLLYGGCNHPQQDEANIATEKATAEGTSSARWVAAGRKEKQGREGSSSGSYSPPHENETNKPVDSRCRATSAKAGLVTNGKKETEEKDDHGKKQGTDSDNDNDSNKNIDNDIDNGIDIDNDIDKDITRGISNGESEKDIPVSHSRFHKGRFRPSGRGFVPYCRPSPRSPKNVDTAKECFQRTPKP